MTKKHVLIGFLLMFGSTLFLTILVFLIDTNKNENITNSKNDEPIEYVKAKPQKKKVETLKDFMDQTQQEQFRFYLATADRMIKDKMVKVNHTDAEIAKLSVILKECVDTAYTHLNAKDLHQTFTFCITLAPLEYKK